MGSTRKIFVVDDDPFCAAMYEEHLLNLGFTSVQSFTSGNELLSNLYQNPGLVMLDHNLEDVKGLELLHHIKGFNPKIHVVVISGQSDMNVAVQFLKSGAFDYIIKDSEDTEKLTAVMNKWVTAIDFTDNSSEEKPLITQDDHLKAVIEAQEQIRREISTQLNDKVNQLLSVSRLYIEAAQEDEENRLALLGETKTAVTSAMIEVKKLVQGLHSPKARINNLEEEIPRMITMLKMMDKFTVLSNLNIQGVSDVLLVDYQQKIIRILQHLINNIIRYSNAKRVLVGITLCDSEVHCMMIDDGVGYDEYADADTLELPELYTQLQSVNSTYELITSPGKGCRWNIHFPINEANSVTN